MSGDYESAIRSEVAAWPGVTVEFGRRSKHREVRFTFNGESRFHVFPDTPSDNYRGVRAKITDVRHLLKAMGAARIERQKSARPKRVRNPGAKQRERRHEAAPVIRDPWAALREVSQ